jgi:hypothetical protein
MTTALKVKAVPRSSPPVPPIICSYEARTEIARYP